MTEPLTLIADSDPVALADDPHADMTAEGARKQAAYAERRRDYRAVNPVRAVSDFQETDQ